MREQMQSRLAELRRDYQLGQSQLSELGRQEVALRETLMRISGAIQVLEEMLNNSPVDPTGHQGTPEALHVP
jgi:prefoldin subunit 5